MLGSQRLLDACVEALGVELGQPASERQREHVREVLLAVAAAQPTDLLMSFDHDVPQHLAGMLSAEFARPAVAVTEAA